MGQKFGPQRRAENALNSITGWGSHSAFFGGFQIVSVSFIKFSFRFCCFVFDLKQLLKVKFVSYVMTIMGANE